MEATTPSTKILKNMLRNVKIMEMNRHLIFTKGEILSNRPLVRGEPGNLEEDFVLGAPISDDDDGDDMTNARRSEVYGELKRKVNKLFKEKVEKMSAAYDKIHGKQN